MLVEQQLSEAAAALEGARQARASEAAAAVDHLAQREAELGATLAEAMTARGALEQTTRRRRGGAPAGPAARRGRARRRRRAPDGDRGESSTGGRHTPHTRGRSCRDTPGVYSCPAPLPRRHFHYPAASREHRGRLESQLTREQAERDERFAATEEEIRSLQQSLGASEDEILRLHGARTEEHASYERARSASESELRRLSAEYDHVREALDQVRAPSRRSSSPRVSRSPSAQARTRCRRTRFTTERAGGKPPRDGQAAETALAQAQERLRLALEASSRDIAQLEHERDALRQELDVTTADREALRSDAERMPDSAEAARRESNGVSHPVRARALRHVPVQFRRRDHARQSIARACARLPDG